MYTKTERIIEIQQSGTNENKPLVEIRPASPAGHFRVEAYVEGREDGAPSNIVIHEYIASEQSDGTNFGPLTTSSDDRGSSGTTAWISNVTQDGSSGPVIFGVHASYGTEAGGPSGTYTVNWKIRTIVEEWT